MTNAELRQQMRINLIPQWKVADIIGVSEMTLIRWLRKELPEEKQQRVLKAIETLKKQA